LRIEAVEPIVLDLRGLKCPLPALRTRKALRTLPVGQLLIVTCTDPLAVVDIPHLVQQTGDRLEQQKQSDDHITFHIRRIT
jgi:tRNA 2-thiouridine synthesizing protein A